MLWVISELTSVRDEIDVRFDTGALNAHALLVEHVVGLIQDEDLALPDIQSSFSNHVLDGARSSDDHCRFNSTGACAGVLRNGGFDCETVDERAHDFHNSHYLAGEFSGGSEHQSLGRLGYGLIAEIETVEDVEHKGSGLASSRLGLTDEILRRIHQEEGQCFLLNLRWLPEVHAGDTFEDVLAPSLGGQSHAVHTWRMATYRPNCSNEDAE